MLISITVLICLYANLLFQTVKALRMKAVSDFIRIPSVLTQADGFQLILSLTQLFNTPVPMLCLDAGEAGVNNTDRHGPCYLGAHILVEERKDNEKVINQVFLDFHKCPEETQKNMELKEWGSSERKLREGMSKEVINGYKWAMWMDKRHI